MGFSICFYRNSICLRLDMLLHCSPKARYVKSERDLSHIELTRSGNISSSSKARTYRVNEVDISTEQKRAGIEGISPFTLALSVCVGAPRSENKSTSNYRSASLWSGLRVSEAKTTKCCFCKRCETKQGARRGIDLRKRWLATMRLEGNSNLFEP